MQNKDIHLIEHLDELRQRIIKTLCAFIFSLLCAFIFVQDIYAWLVRDLNGKLAILGPSDILWVYMTLSGVCALAAAIPVGAFQTWRFVAPALNSEERKVTLRFIPALFLLFILGISFGYFVLFPIVLGFLTNLTAGQFETFFTAEKYFGFMINITLPFGFLFEMPVVVMFLTRLGVIHPERLVKARKISYFALIVVSILITPPDFISDILVIIPLLALYEISISLSNFVYKKKLKAEKVLQDEGLSDAAV
ncbi:sec-independent protein translocase protein TatC [Peribacillus deserti]|uniref:Sec-independent protein translocase protein TatC n=1 Tax=Peribacillus deserti TaxID=673318 RepID=A0ABS2QGC2_9BACI|nr:twin-arginine translocase subunit TatC [Peribacillus deserti]MBM7692211.1 sec-independent protein translocase protein TatC [Peribacillus deserti]